MQIKRIVGPIWHLCKSCLSTLTLMIWMVICVPGDAFADGDVTVQTDKALQKISGNWYDSKSGEYRPPVIDDRIDDSIRQSGWDAPPPSDWWKWWKDWWSSGTGGGGRWGFSSESIAYALLGGLGMILLAGIAFLIYFYLGDQFTWNREQKGLGKIKIDPTKVTDLPFEVDMIRNDPLSEAEAHMKAGRWREATIFLYGYMLLALDQARKIHLQRGKTNRMYLREIRNEVQLHAIVQGTMLAFEDVYFGRYPMDSNRFQQLWNQVDEFHRLLSPAIQQPQVVKVVPI
jgi:hypothetical protein